MDQKPEKDLLTVKEYAEAAGVTQQAVYQRLNKGLSSFVVEVEGKKYLKRQALEAVQERQEFKPIKPSVEQDSSKVEQGFNKVDKLIDTLSKTVDLLQGQLEAKDQQISELNKRLEQALNNTSQSHFIAAQAQKSLTSGDQQEVDPVAADVENKAKGEPLHEKGFFARLFGKG